MKQKKKQKQSMTKFMERKRMHRANQEQAGAKVEHEHGHDQASAAFDWVDAAIAALAQPPSAQELADPLTPGLKMQVDSAGRKSYWIRIFHQGELMDVRVGLPPGCVLPEEVRESSTNPKTTVQKGKQDGCIN